MIIITFGMVRANESGQDKPDLHSFALINSTHESIMINQAKENKSLMYTQFDLSKDEILSLKRLIDEEVEKFNE